MAPELLEFLFRQGHHIRATHQNLAFSRFDQAVEVTDKRGFPRTGQPHDNGDIAILDGQVDILKAQRMAGTGQNFIFPKSLMHQRHVRFRVWPKQFVEPFDFN